jgi:hypothetical protein
MSSKLPFSSINKNDVAIVTAAAFADGTGMLDMPCSDKRTTTADGKIHWVRMAINYRARFVAYDNVKALMSGLTTNTLLGTGEKISLMDGVTTIFERRGVLHGTYDANRHVTQVDINFDSEINFGS